MIDVMFFSYRSTDAWWQYLASQLNFTTSTCVVSDMRGDGTINIVDDFYTHLRQNDAATFARTHLSEQICDDIIRRCRVLRNLKKKTALSMIYAMWQTLDDLIKQQQPRLVMSFIIDRYVLDVLDRVLQSHGIPFLGMTASIVPDQVMFMDRGQLIRVRDPDASDIASARQHIVNDAFTPAYVNRSKKYTHRQYWRTFLLFKMRGLYYQALRFLKRDRLNLHYLDALNHLDHKPQWRDYTVLGLFNAHWEEHLQRCPVNKRVFIGLQLLPEASLDYWLDDLSLLNNEHVMLEICQVLGRAGFTLFVKDHPLQFGFRQRGFMQQLRALPAVVLVPYDIPASRFIQACSVTVTMTGTIGFQSAVAGACSIVSGAYYSDDTHFIQCRSLNDIATLPSRIEAFQANHKGDIADESIDGLLAKVLAASAPGDLFGFKGFDVHQAEHRQRTVTLIESLNRYLPHFLTPKELA
ncbi:MAG TPA: hypothetical protein DDY37_06195 [Legionella sp.]|nr:hypothetical protein [Legionella sp.]